MMRLFDIAREEQQAVTDAGVELSSTIDGAHGTTAPDAPARRVRWRRVVWQAVALWLTTRAALVLFTCFAIAFHLGPQSHTAVTPRALALHWERWDALWYLGIAQHGYASAQATAFFPLYPLLIRAAALVIGPHWLAAGLLVANLGTLGGFIGLALLAASEASAEAPAWGAIRVLAAYPLAFFLAAPYSDGLLLAFAACGLLAARRGRWGWATLCVCLALLDRPTGAVLLVPVLWEYASAHRGLRWTEWRGQWHGPEVVRAVGGATLILGLAALVIGLYMTFLWRQFGDPLLFLHAEHQFWHHQSIVTLHTTVHTVAASSRVAAATSTQAAVSVGWSYEVARALVDLVPVVLFALLLVVGAKRLPVSFSLYMGCLLLLIVSSPRPERLGYFVSAGRYFIAAVPAFVLLGRWVARRPWLDMLLVSGGFLLQAVFAAYFLAGGWMV